MATPPHVRAELAPLDEDLRAAWVPDPLGDADANARIDLVHHNGWPTLSRGVEHIRVPKPDGTALLAPVLSVPWLVAMCLAVDPIKDQVDAALSPSVCGYRRGAEPGRSYGEEHRRFSEMVAAEADNCEYVVTADVCRFFASTSWEIVLRAAERIATADTIKPLLELVDHFQTAGVHYLPAGYADARFLANLVLIHADRSIQLPFARWVDDYRIFASTREEAAAAVQRLHETLCHQGLALNHSKVSVVPSSEFVRTARGSFTSVYHPETEPKNLVRAGLRSVFLEAAVDPINRRRELRFALPRLAGEKDNVAVDWGLKALPTIPWEAPRLIAYLVAFGGERRVRQGIESQLLSALKDNDTWLACRLAAAVCTTGLRVTAQAEVMRAMSKTDSAALWGLLLRALALSGLASVVVEIRHRVLDERAAAAALIDLGIEVPEGLTTLVEATMRALDGQPAPAPNVDTIL